jgi:hypothetical protein
MWLLGGEQAKEQAVFRERQRALEDVQLAQHARDTRRQHESFKKARAATCDELRIELGRA